MIIEFVFMYLESYDDDTQPPTRRENGARDPNRKLEQARDPYRTL